MQKKVNFFYIINNRYSYFTLKIHFFLLYVSFFVFLLFVSVKFFTVVAKENNSILKHYFQLNKIESDFNIKKYFNIYENILIFQDNNKILKIFLNKNIAISGYKVFTSKIPVVLIYNKKIYILDYFIYKYLNSFFIVKKNIDYYKNYFNNFNSNYNADVILGNALKNNYDSSDFLINKNNSKKGKEADIEFDLKKKNSNLVSYAKKEIIEYRKIKYLIIDPGHGGKDPGAIYNGIKEKDVNLYIAKKLQLYLSKRLKNIKIILTRTSDKYISLENRVKIANKYNNQYYTGIFISIHANASPFSKKTNGLEIYYLDYNLVDEKIKNLVKYENKEVTNPIIGSIINRLLNEELIYESKKIASYIFNSYKKQNNPIKAKSIYGAPFYVLAYTSLPSILIELGYISNKNDAKNILSKKFVDSLFKSIENGIKEYIDEYNRTEGFKNIKK